MMKALATGAFIALMAVPAVAQEAEVATDLNMRAGPATRFPIITTIPEGRSVEVYRCVSDFDWCDVGWRGFRGWVFTDYLEYYYRNAYRPVIEWGPRIGLPVISFTFGDYARRHYRGMPWYEDRWRWERDRRDRRDRRGRDWDDDDNYESRNRDRRWDDDDYERRVRRLDQDDMRDDDAMQGRWPGSDDDNAPPRRVGDNDQQRGGAPGRRVQDCDPSREDCAPGRSQSRGAANRTQQPNVNQTPGGSGSDEDDSD